MSSINLRTVCGNLGGDSTLLDAIRVGIAELLKGDTEPEQDDRATDLILQHQVRRDYPMPTNVRTMAFIQN
jgi:hypothetical protein